MLDAFTGIESALDAVIFDFDGVIVESTDIKTEVFRTLFADHPHQLDQIIAYHEANAGISRYVKFRTIYREILQLPLSDAEAAKLAMDFETLAVDRVVDCPMVRGAKAVLDLLSHRIPLAIASGTPEPELRLIVERRGLTASFISVCGSPRTKDVIIEDLIAQFSWRRSALLMVGDARADFDAAQTTCIHFVGRCSTTRLSPFPEKTRCIADLTELAGAVASLPLGVASGQAGKERSP